MQVLPQNLVKVHLTEAELAELREFLQEMGLKPKLLYRQFSDVEPVAKLLKKAFPQVPVQAYPGCFNTAQKISNWICFERNVLQRYGVRLTKMDIELIANCTPGAVDMLLYTIMNIMKEQQTTKAVLNAEQAETEQENKKANAAAAKQNKNVENTENTPLAIYSVNVNNEPEDKTQRMVSYMEYEQVLQEYKHREWKIAAAQKTIQTLKKDLLAMRNRTEKLEKKLRASTYAKNNLNAIFRSTLKR